jgi:hypothetical protein
MIQGIQVMLSCFASRRDPHHYVRVAWLDLKIRGTLREGHEVLVGNLWLVAWLDKSKTELWACTQGFTIM